MQHQDNIILELKMSKNSLESYVYDMRAHLDDTGDYKDYLQQETRVTFLARLKELEVWIYGEGSDAPREKYLEILKELRAVGDPVRARVKFHQEMPALIQQFMDVLQEAGQRAADIDPEKSHITAEEKAKVLELAANGTEYVQGIVKSQEGRALFEDPVVTEISFQQRKDEFAAEAGKILNKPPPPPPKKEEENTAKVDEEKDKHEAKEEKDDVEMK